LLRVLITWRRRWRMRRIRRSRGGGLDELLI